jgi:hypothetical protein
MLANFYRCLTYPHTSLMCSCFYHVLKVQSHCCVCWALFLRVTEMKLCLWDFPFSNMWPTTSKSHLDPELGHLSGQGKWSGDCWDPSPANPMKLCLVAPGAQNCLSCANAAALGFKDQGGSEVTHSHGWSSMKRHQWMTDCLPISLDERDSPNMFALAFGRIWLFLG